MGYLGGFIIVWLILPFIVAYAGEKKKIGYWGTFWICIFFSPVIALIVAALSARKSAGVVGVCKFCGFNNTQGDPFCPGCGKDVTGYTTSHYKKLSSDPAYKADSVTIDDKAKEEERLKDKMATQKDVNTLIVALIIISIICVTLVVLKKIGVT